MVTGGPGQKPDLKKRPGLSDSDMVTGGKTFSIHFSIKSFRNILF